MQEKHGSALVGGLIAGIVAGAVAGLLLAPKAGNVTRRFAKQKSAQYYRNARARLERSKAARG